MKPDLTPADLAKRVLALGDITCPLCGEGSMDVAGFVSHTSWCQVAAVVDGFMPNSQVAERLLQAGKS